MERSVRAGSIENKSSLQAFVLEETHNINYRKITRMRVCVEGILKFRVPTRTKITLSIPHEINKP
jgi:hypothetical protein